MERVEKKCQQLNVQFKEIDHQYFFGTYHTDYKNFKFGPYEMKIIRDLIQHVKHIFNIKGLVATIEYFSKNDDKILWLSDWFFKTESTEQSTVQSILENDAPKTHQSHTHQILYKLLETANKNITRKEGGYRFNYDLKSYAAVFRMLSGPMAYELLQKNLPLALPSLSATNRFINQSHRNVIEAELRSHELYTYLVDRDLPLQVCLSEDATRITNRVQYDSTTNQLLGFVPPLDKNGLPIPFSFKARSAKEIEHHFSTQSVAKSVITIMAKPFGAPAFCLLVFGSNAKYTARDVANRWSYIVKELNKLHIQVISISSDSDPKYNSAMRNLSQLGVPFQQHQRSLFKKNWFKCGDTMNGTHYFQDTIHLLLKFRNLMLKTITKSDLLPFGSKYHIKMDHLQYLLDRFSKDKHGLTKTSLNPVDRQNFAFVERICDTKVINLLKKHVNNSEATAIFLQMMQDVKSAFMDTSLSPVECIRKMWFSIFLMRLWREYISKTNGLNRKDNFLTSFSYYCFELNCHNLLLLVMFLRRTNQPHLFVPINFSSQPCEEFYRWIRSFTTVYSTKANCTTKEFCGRIKKIQLQNDIGTSNKEFLFPRIFSSKKLPKVEIYLPSEEEIIEIVEKCRTDAISYALKIGLLNVTVSDIPCKVDAYVAKPIKLEMHFASMKISEDGPILDLKNVDIKNFADKFSKKKISETSPYVEIYNAHKRKVVKKMSLCWVLSTDVIKLSSDRVYRVRDSNNVKNSNKIVRRIQFNAGKKYKQKRKRRIRARNTRKI